MSNRDLLDARAILSHGISLVATRGEGSGRSLESCRLPSMPRSATRKNHRPRLDRQGLEKVAEMFRVLSEPTRLQLLQELRSGPRSVSELVEALGTSQANVSKQLKTLYDASFLTRRKRGNQVFYEVGEPMVYELCELVCDKLNRDVRSAAVYDFSI